MNILSFPSTKNPVHITTQISKCSLNLKAHISSSKSRHFPGRDRVIDFGKHKGKMLGTLPSTYLKWVSKNLRARDFEDWAKLADEVLDDPVYRDRIEWEFAEKLLSDPGSPLSMKDGNFNSPVSELLELSERFGWDNEDKKGWSKIDFKMLGTSKGGRIPRLGERNQTKSTMIGLSGVSYTNMTSEIQKNEYLDGVMKNDEVRGCNEGEEETRKERRERLRAKRSGSNRQNKLRAATELRIDQGRRPSMPNTMIEENGGGRFEIREDLRGKGNQNIDEGGNVEMQSRFPGREGLLRKVLSGRKPF